jgi:hypothetical protein
MSSRREVPTFCSRTEGRVQCRLSCIVVPQLPLVLLYMPPAGSVVQSLSMAAIVRAREDGNTSRVDQGLLAVR